MDRTDNVLWKVTMLARIFDFELTPEGSQIMERGQIEATDEADARRQLRVKYLCAILPTDTKIIDRREREQRETRARSVKMRGLLRVLNAHYLWLKGDQDGERADLSHVDLQGVSLADCDLRNADFSGADLSNADLQGADLTGATMAGAELHRADLRGAKLCNVDLSDVDLRETRLTGADLSGADLWRANLMGAEVAPATLHSILKCKSGTRGKGAAH